MDILFWDCEYSDYDDYWDGVNEYPVYSCTHPKGNGACVVDNKHSEDDCSLLDKQT